MPSLIEDPSGRMLEKAPRWDPTGTKGYGGGKVFWWTLLVVWEYLGIWVFMEQELGLEDTRGAHKPSGRPQGAPRWVVASSAIF